MTDGFTITRVFDAPRELVWKMWTDPDELTHWFHPNEMSSPRDDIRVDAREGGSYAYTMVGDESGDRYPTAGTYLEVVEPERLVFTWAEPGEPVDGAPVITVDLAEKGDGTELTFTLRGAPGRPGDDGVYDGWAQALDHLAGRLGAVV